MYLSQIFLIDDYYRLMKETYFEEYYSLIKPFTFKSEILELTIEELKLINAGYQTYSEDKNEYQEWLRHDSCEYPVKVTGFENRVFSMFTYEGYLKLE